MENQPFDLDPELENSVDIQELFNNSDQVNDETLEELILEIQSTDDENSLDLMPLSAVILNNGSSRYKSCFSELDFMTSESQIKSCLGSLKNDISPKNELVSLQTVLSPGMDDNMEAPTGMVTPPPSPYDLPPPRPRGRPGRKPSAGGPVRKKRQPQKGSAEYYDKRARNNLAIRKCREKAKQKQMEVEERLQSLEDDNDRLNQKLEQSNKQLTILKNFLLSQGTDLPEDIAQLICS